jgi:hypothetical protein
MSAAIAAQSEAYSAAVSTAKSNLTARESPMFSRMILSVRRECQTSQGSFEMSSDMSATSPASMAASVPPPPIAMPSFARPSAGASLMPSPTIATLP